MGLACRKTPQMAQWPDPSEPPEPAETTMEVLMKVGLYNQIVSAGLTRRGVLKGAAATGGLAAFGGLTFGTADTGARNE